METAVAFGRELQQERERRGISLDAVAEATKVASKYLLALERDDHASLPGGVFNKGFIRSYCRFLGLDENVWLNRFAATAHTNGTEPDWAEFAENVKRTRVQTTPQARKRWWGVALMLLALAAIVWPTWHYVLQPRLMIDPRPSQPATAIA